MGPAGRLLHHLNSCRHELATLHRHRGVTEASRAVLEAALFALDACSLAVSVFVDSNDREPNDRMLVCPSPQS